MAKAKEVQPWIEKMFRYAKMQNRHEANRKVHAVLFENDVQKKLFEELLPKYEDHTGTHTKITRI